MYIYYTCRIVDTPGLFDTVTKQEEIKFELSKVIDECITGIDVFLYVHNGTVRFSPEEQETVRELEVSYLYIFSYTQTWTYIASRFFRYSFNFLL